MQIRSVSGRCFISILDAGVNWEHITHPIRGVSKKLPFSFCQNLCVSVTVPVVVFFQKLFCGLKWILFRVFLCGPWQISSTLGRADRPASGSVRTSCRAGFVVQRGGLPPLQDYLNLRRPVLHKFTTRRLQGDADDPPPDPQFFAQNLSLATPQLSCAVCGLLASRRHPDPVTAHPQFWQLAVCISRRESASRIVGFFRGET